LLGIFHALRFILVVLVLFSGSAKVNNDTTTVFKACEVAAVTVEPIDASATPEVAAKPKDENIEVTDHSGPSPSPALPPQRKISLSRKMSVGFENAVKSIQEFTCRPRAGAVVHPLQRRKMHKSLSFSLGKKAGPVAA
jgi:hypothetical protein